MPKFIKQQYLNGGDFIMRKNGVKNLYEVKGNIVYLYITNKNYTNKEVIFNIKHLEEIKKYRWTINNCDYCITTSKVDERYILMHRLIVDCPESLVVDHINHNTLDNRDNNLRICDQGDNLKNLKTRIDNKSGFRGISFHKRSGKWRCEMRVEGKKKWLGLYNTPEEAFKVRQAAEKEFYGEYRYIDKEVNASTAIDAITPKLETVCI